MLKAVVPMQALDARGILVTASAGNDGENTDTNPHVPSTLTTPNIIAVGATQSGGAYWSGSNFGAHSWKQALPRQGYPSQRFELPGPSASRSQADGNRLDVCATRRCTSSALGTTGPPHHF